MRQSGSHGPSGTLAYKLIGSGDGTINPRSLEFYDCVLFPFSRALQVLTGKFFGKNVMVVATKA